eukprot:2522297-Amphidinium_carterae.1
MELEQEFVWRMDDVRVCYELAKKRIHMSSMEPLLPLLPWQVQVATSFRVWVSSLTNARATALYGDCRVHGERFLARVTRYDDRVCTIALGPSLFCFLQGSSVNVSSNLRRFYMLV